MTKKQKTFLNELLANGINVAAALETTGTKPTEFKKFIADQEFKEEYDAICDSIAESKFIDLVKSGDPKANIEFQKRKNITLDQDKKVQADVMEAFINLCETKSQILTLAVEIFKITKTKAEDLFKTVKIERRLLSPYERKKKKEKDKDSQLSVRFMNGTLSEIDMYKRLLEIHLHDAENAEYPSERSRATDKVMDINRRLDEIKLREEQKERISDYEIAERVDALILGTSEEHVQEVSKIVDSEDAS